MQLLGLGEQRKEAGILNTYLEEGCVELKCRPLGRGCCVPGAGISELEGRTHWGLEGMQ